MAVTDEAIGKIKEMIVRGDLKPGSRLPPEKELADELGLSRSSLREAVKALEVIRVLDVRRGDGTYVTSLEPSLLLEAMAFAVDLHSDDSLLEIFAVRRILESHAARLAAQVATSKDISELSSEVRSVDPGADVGSLIEHDIRFHSAIARIAGNNYLASLLASLTTQTVRARVWRGLSETGVAQRTLAEHRTIFDAIASGDVSLAGSAAELHVFGVERWLQRAKG